MIRFLLRWIVLPAVVLVAALLALVLFISEGVGGRDHPRGAIARQPRPDSEVAGVAEQQRVAVASIGAPDDSQILFGDLHVHTTYSGDAFVFSLPLFQGEGVHPPADACDFARFCSVLDFYSINDHAEYLTPQQWSETRESIRECNAVTDPTNPDLVAFLGWEWTQSAPAFMGNERTHYGHKNVVLLDTEEGSVPTRPIGAGEGGLFAAPIPSVAWLLARFTMATRDLGDLRPYLDFNAFARRVRAMDECPAGVPVRDLPDDCLEGAATSGELFAKLDDWGFESLVIPHGTSWGIHAPPYAGLDDQLSKADHDPERQRLFEVYSGHGSSEVWSEMRDFTLDADGTGRCAEPSDGYLPCCWQAGELIRDRCEADLPEVECEARVERARQLAVDSGSAYGVVAGTTPDDWLECGQLSEGFLPAYEYRPNMSAQYGLALRAEDGSTYRYGLIGSSDNHKGRAGPGYKELARKAYGDAYGLRSDWFDAVAASPVRDPLPVEKAGPLAGLGVGSERGASFYYTSGLVAVHSESRERGAIWNALRSRNAYGTSGDRILLWFDLVNAPGGSVPMGSEVEIDTLPRFEVRAVGALEQKPGCPASVHERLGPERMRRLCLDECYHPGDLRRRIQRIEVVRIRKQQTPGEPVAELIEDPWRVFECSGEREGCRVSFVDPEAPGERETVYYVRALQEPTPAVNGDPMRCERDEQGRCVKARACSAAGPRFEPEDDCLSEVRERAWSSPIFVR